MDKQKFPQLLSEERTRRGYTQKQVAEALGVSDKTYSKWETGVNEMTVETLCRLAEFYGCSPAVFFAEERPAQGSPTQRDLKTMTPVQAFLYLREMIDEAYAVFSDFEWMRNPGLGADENLPTLPAPENDLGGFISIGDGFLLRQWDADADLRLLLLPSENGNAWLKEETEALSALFRALSHAELTALLLLSPEDSWFTPEYLSRETDLSVEEVRESMELFCRLRLSFRRTTRTPGGSRETYSRPNTRLLRAILTLAHRLVTKGEGEVHNVTS